MYLRRSEIPHSLGRDGIDKIGVESRNRSVDVDVPDRHDGPRRDERTAFELARFERTR